MTGLAKSPGERERAPAPVRDRDAPPGAAADGADAPAVLLAPPERVLSTLNRDGSRRWLLPRVSPGRFLTLRRWLAYALIALFAVLPFLHVHGRPAVLLNLAQREFTILGFTFLPTDTVLLALFLLAAIISIFLLTALLGRIWCGWACPQTVYLEFVYRPLERLIDGTLGRGGRPGGTGAAWRRVVKFIVFFAVSAVVAHIFLAYFVGVEALARWVRQSPIEHPLPFLVMAGTTLLMLFDFGYFREQTCIVACPYGRLQAVLLDRQSLIINYDTKRGEPRGKARRASGEARGAPGPALQVTGRLSPADVRAPGPGPLPVTAMEGPSQSELRRAGVTGSSGDCIDCHLCVATCPTGIDIRDGLQMECIGCAQCIDACDAVMQKIGRPRGLIRYGSQAALEGEPRKFVRPRVVLYPALLLILVAALITMFVTKQSTDVTLLRGYGRPFVELPDGLISNALRMKLTNRTVQSAVYAFSIVADAQVQLRTDENPVAIAAGESREVPLLLVAPRAAFTAGVRDVTVRVCDAHGFARDVKYRLLGPHSSAAPPETPDP